MFLFLTFILKLALENSCNNTESYTKGTANKVNTESVSRKSINVKKIVLIRFYYCLDSIEFVSYSIMKPRKQTFSKV